MMRSMRICSSIAAAVVGLTVGIEAAVNFTPVTTGPIVADSSYSRSVNFIDYDNDTYLDIFVGNGATNAGVNKVNVLYHNNGDGTFSKITNDTIVNIPASSDGTTWGDFDNDGDLDCYVSTWRGQKNLFFVNNGDGTFSRDTVSPTVADTGWSDFSAWADYDRDGQLDLLVAQGFGTVQTNLLFQNTGGGSLAPLASVPLTTTSARWHGIAWGDYDNDRDLDVYITTVNQGNGLFRNDGSGAFTRINTTPFSTDITTSIRCAWGDIDNDLDLDLFVTNAGTQNDLLYRNNGNGTFTKITTGPAVTDGVSTNSGGFADIDNDGDLDLFVTLGFVPGQLFNRLYYNNGDGTFVREMSGIVVNDTGWSHGFAFGDIEHDGDLDMVVARNLNEKQNCALYLNDGTPNHFADISCQGVASNRDGNGVRVLAKATINGTPRWQMRELTSPTGFGQNGLSAWFGLGDATVIDSLVIRWPAGTTDYYFDVSAGQFLTYVECADSDGDGIGCGDNCPGIANQSQVDSNGDGFGDACCCVGTTGNVDCDVVDGVDIGDLTTLIDNLFITFAPLCCDGEANADDAGGTDIGDLTALIDNLFITFTPLPNCQ